jgi:hypothetical protein
MSFWRCQSNILGWGVETQAQVCFAPELTEPVVSPWHIFSMFCDLGLWSLKYPRSFDHFGYIQPFPSVLRQKGRSLSPPCPENCQTWWFLVKHKLLQIIPKFGPKWRYDIQILLAQIPLAKSVYSVQNKGIYPEQECLESSLLRGAYPRSIFFRG